MEQEGSETTGQTKTEDRKVEHHVRGNYQQELMQEGSYKNLTYMTGQMGHPIEQERQQIPHCNLTAEQTETKIQTVGYEKKHNHGKEITYMEMGVAQDPIDPTKELSTPLPEYSYHTINHGIIQIATTSRPLRTNTRKLQQII